MSEYSELLAFVQETGVKIAELQEQILQLTQDNAKLQREVERYKGKFELEQEKVKNLADICDSWHSQYSDISREKGQLEDTVEVMTNALAILSPKLEEEVKKDLGDGMFSDLLNYTKRRNHFYF